MRLARRALSHRPAGGLERDGADRLLLLPGVHRGLLRRALATSPQQDVDLVVCLGDYIYEQAFVDGLDQCAGPRRRRPPTARRRRSPSTGASTRSTTPTRTCARFAAHFALVGDVGRPRGRGQLRRRPTGGAAKGPPRPLRRAPRQRLPRVVRAHAAPAASGAAEDLRLAAAGQRRAVHPRLAPVPRRPAVQPDGRRAVAAVPAETTDDPSRTLLGAEQKAWLKGALAASRARWKVIANQVMICSLDAPPHNPLNTDSWDGYGAERAELVDHIAADAHRRRHLRHRRHPHVLRGRRHAHRPADGARREDRIDPVNGPVRATEFVGGAITSPGIVDRASTETERVAAAAPADAAVLANNPHLAYANQAYKGYCIVEAGAGQLDVPLPGGPRAARPRLGRLHPAPLPRGLRPARGHRSRAVPLPA